jgi:hypothetical protein
VDHPQWAAPKCLSHRSLWVKQIQSQSEAQIVADEPGRQFFGLTFTPDGNEIDFVALDAGAPVPALWRIPFLGGKPRKIENNLWCRAVGAAGV